MMDMNQMGSWGMGFGWVIMLVFWGVVIFGILYLLKFNSTSSDAKSTEKSAMEILKLRYAHGEIEQQEYEQKKHEIEN